MDNWIANEREALCYAYGNARISAEHIAGDQLRSHVYEYRQC